MTRTSGSLDGRRVASTDGESIPVSWSAEDATHAAPGGRLARIARAGERRRSSEPEARAADASSTARVGGTEVTISIGHIEVRAAPAGRSPPATGGAAAGDARRVSRARIGRTMSDYLAVAGVSAVLKWMLSNALTMGGPTTILTGATSITALSPDLVSTGADEQPQVNLFMYYASLNAAYRNTMLPSFDSQGRRTSNPPLALNLHYLVSAYGKNEFDAEILLAWAMQTFHDNPVLSRATIESSLEAMASSGSPTPEVLLLTGTTLADQFELIKITPEALTNDEISKLWMAFETHYRPTTSYQATVVLIQDTAAVQVQPAGANAEHHRAAVAGPDDYQRVAEHHRDGRGC